MATISNYLNGNYLLSKSFECQLVLIEYPSKSHYEYHDLTHFPIRNAINQNLAVAIIDFGMGFDSKFVALMKAANERIYHLPSDGDLPQLFKRMNELVPKEQSLHVIVKDIEVLEYTHNFRQVIQFIKQLTKLPAAALQVTILVSSDLIGDELFTCLTDIANCRIVVQPNLRLTMVLRKPNGSSLIKEYVVSKEKLRLGQLKIDKIKQTKQLEVDVESKIQASFNLTLSEQQRQQRALLDQQINPYKKINQATAPLIFNREEDAKKLDRADEEEVLDDDDV